MSRSPARPGGTLVLDSEGLAKAVPRDREVTGWLALARADDLRVITSAAALVGHRRHALRDGAGGSGPVALLTSNPDDLELLCGKKITVIKV